MVHLMGMTMMITVRVMAVVTVTSCCMIVMVTVVTVTSGCMTRMVAVVTVMLLSSLTRKLVRICVSRKAGNGNQQKDDGANHVSVCQDFDVKRPFYLFIFNQVKAFIYYVNGSLSTGPWSCHNTSVHFEI